MRSIDPQKMALLRREFQLSERTLRQLFIRHPGEEVPTYVSPGKEYSDRGFGPRRSAHPARGEARKPMPTPAKTTGVGGDAKAPAEVETKGGPEIESTS